jgi:hypothetical protein
VKHQLSLANRGKKGGRVPKDFFEKNHVKPSVG